MSNKNGIYELPHKLLNDLRLWVLLNQKIFKKYQICMEKKMKMS